MTCVVRKPVAEGQAGMSLTGSALGGIHNMRLGLSWLSIWNSCLPVILITICLC